MAAALGAEGGPGRFGPVALIAVTVVMELLVVFSVLLPMSASLTVGAKAQCACPVCWSSSFGVR
jgi:hypothetical protein